MAASAELDIIFQAKNQARGVINEVGRDLTGLEKQSTSIAARTARAVGTIAKAGAVAIAGASVIAGAAYVKTAKDSVQMAYNLEDQMYAIAAVMGKTRDEIKPLDDIITNLGLNPNLKVTTQEAADIMEMLAKNGLTRLADAGGNMEEVFGQAALTTIQLANATGGDFVEAAGVATDALWQFNMGAEDMAKVADQATAVVNFSKADFEDYRYALSAVGGVAGSVGVEFDDMNTAIAQIIPNFSGGQTAGTAMKQFLISLVPKSETAADAMEKLGLEFFDAQGNMKSMAEITDELNQAFYQGIPVYSYQNQLTADQNRQLLALQKSYKKTSEDIADYQAGIKGADLSEEKRQETLNNLNDELAKQQEQIAKLEAARGDLVATTHKLTEQERLTYLHDIFGTRAFIVAQGLAKITGEEFDNLHDIITQDGVAAESAATRMQSLAGATEIFGGVFESIKIQAGMRYLDGLKDAVREATVTLSYAAPTLIDALAAPADFIDNTVVPSLKNLNAILESGGVVLNLADMIHFTWDWKQDKYKLDLGTIATFTAQMVPEGGIKLAINDQEIDTSSVKTAILSSLDALGVDLATATPEKMAEAAGALVGSFSAQIVTVATGETASGMAEAAKGLVSGFVTQVKGLATTDIGGMAEAAQGMATTFLTSMTTAFFSEIPTAALLGGVGMVIAAKGLVDGFVAQIQEQATIENAEGLATAAQGLVTSLGMAVVAAATGETAQGLATAAQGLVTSLGENITGYFQGEGWATTKQNVVGAMDQLGVAVEGTLSPDGVLGGAVQTAIGWIDDASAAIAELDPAQAGEALNGVLEFVTGLLGSVKGFEVGAQAEAFSAVTDLVTSMLNLTADVGDELDPDLVANIAKSMITGLSNEIQTALSDEKSLALGDAAGSLVRTFATKLTEVLSTPDLGKDMGAAAGEGVGAITTAAANLVTGFADQIAATDWGALSESVSSFTGDFVIAAAGAMKDVDWGPVAQALVDSLASAVAGIFFGTVGQYSPMSGTAFDALMAQTASNAPPEVQAALNQQFTWSDLKPQWVTNLFGGGNNQLSGAGEPEVQVIGAISDVLPPPSGEPEVQIIGAISDVLPPSSGEPEVQIIGKVTKASVPQPWWGGWLGGGSGQSAAATTTIATTAATSGAAQSSVNWGVVPSLPVEVPDPLPVDVPEPLAVDVPPPLKVETPSEPGWVSSLLGWHPTVSIDVNVTGGGGGGGGFGETPPPATETPPNGDGNGPPFALGGRTRGGSFLAGEFGPELVTTAGPAHVFTADETDQILNGRGAPVIIQATINTPVDLESLAYRVADLIGRRGRR